MRFSMRYLNTQDLYDTHIIIELLASLKPGFQGHENVFSKENLALDLPTNYGTSFVDLAEAKLFFVYVACFVVHSGIYLTEKHGFFV